jgi:signal transduction histidine kinase
VSQGVQQAFHNPPLAWYTAFPGNGTQLTRILQQELILPPTLPRTAVAALVGVTGRVIEQRALHQQSGPLDDALNIVVYHPRVVLWCPVRHTQTQHLLGMLLLGMRNDLDPYRPADVAALGHFLDAVALALTNSAAYVACVQAEATIRELYQHVQQVQDRTAAAIARELHDEVININVRLNIETLEQVLCHIPDSPLYVQLQTVLESERTTAHMLRFICENLYPTGMDDPLALPSLLRRLVDRIQATWNGTCQLVVEHAPCPLTTTVQQEVVRITRESLTNAIKHAQASHIIVQLCYPTPVQPLACLTVRDNGRATTVVQSTPGHWGVGYMMESARRIGAYLAFEQPPGGGTAMVLMFTPTILGANLEHEGKGQEDAATME